MLEKILSPLVSAIRAGGGEYQSLRARDRAFPREIIRRPDIVSESLRYGEFIRTQAAGEPYSSSSFDGAYQGMRKLEDEVLVPWKMSFRLPGKCEIELNHEGHVDDLAICTYLRAAKWSDRYICYRIHISDPWIHTAILKVGYSGRHDSGSYLCDISNQRTFWHSELATPRNLGIIHEFQDLLAISLEIARSREDTKSADALQAIIDLTVIRETIAQYLLSMQETKPPVYYGEVPVRPNTCIYKQ